jgi:phage replication O-like protein O
MAKKIKTQFTPVFNDVLCDMAKAKLKPTEWQFLMALWRLTWGRRNMKHKASGKLTTWKTAPFMELTGLKKNAVWKAKVSLLEKKMIIQQQGKIGFNKRWSSASPKQETKTVSQIGDETSPKQETDVSQTGDGKARKPSAPTNLQPLKKERKKNIYSEEFELVWKRYPKGKGKHAGWVAYKSHVIKHRNITHEALAELLEQHRPDLVAKIKADGSDQYIKGFGPWINSRPWDDDRDDSPSGELRERLIYLNTKLKREGLTQEERYERQQLEIANRRKT